MVTSSSMVDYYQELGIDRYATSTDIRTAYKRLALIWHPDRNKAKNAEEKFKKIKQAYDILIDDNRKREYDQQQNTWFETTTNMDYTPPNEDSFNLHAFDHFMSTPIDPFDILNDIQFFQESDFTSKMMNSSSYRHLYTHIFNTMNNTSSNNRHIPSPSTINLNSDRRRKKSRKSSKRSSINSIPVIHSTMANDWFLNELIDLHEQQNLFYFQSSFLNDLTHCTNCEKNISGHRIHLIQHEQRCRRNPFEFKTNRHSMFCQ